MINGEENYDYMNNDNDESDNNVTIKWHTETYYTKQQTQERNLYGTINYKRSLLHSKEYFKYFKLRKCKSVLLQAWSGPGGSRKLSSQILWQRHRMVVRLSALYTGRLYPRKYTWYLFLLEA